MLNGDNAALTITVGTGNFASAFGQTRPFTIGTRSKAIVYDFLLYARCCFFERDAQSYAHIAAFFSHISASSRAAAEKRAEQVAHAAETAAKQIFEINILGSAAARSARNSAETIVLSSFIRIAQNVISLVKLLKAIFSIRILVHIGMKLTGLLTESFLDLIVACRLVNAKHLV